MRELIQLNTRAARHQSRLGILSRAGANIPTTSSSPPTAASVGKASVRPRHHVIPASTKHARPTVIPNDRSVGIRLDVVSIIELPPLPSCASLAVTIRAARAAILQT